jgi:UDP-glucose 4-epimerase
MSTVAVTGAGGFVGQGLCAELARRGHDVLPIPRPLLESADLASRLRGVDCLVHLAARAHMLNDQAADPGAEFRRANVVLTHRVGDAARDAGVRRFLFMSSAGVLGVSSPPGGFVEDSPAQPHDDYTRSKLEAEQWLTAELGSRLELVILRPPLIHGPAAKGNLMRLLRLALRGWPLPIGALRAPRSILALRNLVDLVAHLTEQQMPVRGTMLVADRETTSIAELFREVADCAGHHPWLAPVPMSLIKALLFATGRTGDLSRLTGEFVMHPRIARSQCGWEPPYSMRAEIRRMVDVELQARGQHR